MNLKRANVFLIWLISKQKKTQEPAWSHLIDFLKMQILGKNHLSASKTKRVMLKAVCIYMAKMVQSCETYLSKNIISSAAYNST